MNQHDTQPLSGTIFDDNAEITVVELCELCSVDQQTIDALIEEGILEPRYREGSPRLPYRSVRVTNTVIRLQRDLGVNLAGAALAVDLLEHIDALRARLRQR